MYIHVPAAWIGLASFTSIALLSILSFIFKIKNFSLITKSIAPIGLMFTCIAIVTGSIWGKPTWGTWWAWDARVTSMLILALFYIGFISTHKFILDENKALNNKLKSIENNVDKLIYYNNTIDYIIPYYEINSKNNDVKHMEIIDFFNNSNIVKKNTSSFNNKSQLLDNYLKVTDNKQTKFDKIFRISDFQWKYLPKSLDNLTGKNPPFKFYITNNITTTTNNDKKKIINNIIIKILI